MCSIRKNNESTICIRYIIIITITTLTNEAQNHQDNWYGSEIWLSWSSLNHKLQPPVLWSLDTIIGFIVTSLTNKCHIVYLKASEEDLEDSSYVKSQCGMSGGREATGDSNLTTGKNQETFEDTKYQQN